MTTSFPAALDALTNPSSSTPQSGNADPNLDHHAQHANANDAIEAVQAKLGADGVSYTFVPASATAGTAINTAIAALPSTGGTIRLGAGTHTLDTAVLWDRELIIEGVGSSATLVRFDGATIPTAFKMADTTQRRIVMRNMRIESITNGSGLAIDGSKCVTSLFDVLRIGSSTQSPNKGISFPVVGSYYNHVKDCVISVAGSAPVGVEWTNSANSNMATNVKVNVFGSTTGTGFYIGGGAHSICLVHPDVENNDAIGIDVGATSHDVTIVSPYLELDTIGVRLASGVESVRIVGGYISNATTANIQDNGAVGFTYDNLWLNFDPASSLDRAGVVKSRVNGINAPGNAFQAEDVGYIAWAYDPVVITNQSSVVNGTLYLCQLNIRYPATITNLVVQLQAGATTPTANQNYLGLYNSAGAKVAATAAAAFDTPSATSGGKSVALSTPYAAAAGKYWVAILMNAATPAMMFRNGSVLNANPGLAAAAARFAINGTGLTSLPSSITPASNVIASGIPFWVAAS